MPGERRTVEEFADDDELARCKRALAETLVRAHLDGLGSPQPDRRAKAAGRLGVWGRGDVRAVTALESALADDNGRVRKAARAALRAVRSDG